MKSIENNLKTQPYKAVEHDFISVINRLKTLNPSTTASQIGL